MLELDLRHFEKISDRKNICGANSSSRPDINIIFDGYFMQRI